MNSQSSDDFGEEATALFLLPLGSVPSPGVINLLGQLRDTVMTGERVPPGPPRGEDLTVIVRHGLPMEGRWRVARPNIGRLHGIAT